MNATGEVIATTGVVIAIDDNGTRRILQTGDSVSIGEQIVTGEIGSIAVEFDNGMSWDLGRDDSQTLSLEEETPEAENQTDQTEDSAEAEVEAEQETLLMVEDSDPTDPTTGMEAPGAGPDAGPTEDDGHSVVQNEHLAPRQTPESGFETVGISLEFPELPPELIQDPITPVTAAGPVAPVIPEPIAPEVSIFRLKEAGNEQEARIKEGEPANIGYRIDPVDGDIVTQIIISGFPENDAPNDQPDWGIVPFAFNDDDFLDYDVNFVEYSQSSPGEPWQVVLDIQGSDPGEEIDFLLNTQAPNDVPDGTNAIPLQVQTTVENSAGVLFTSSAEVNIQVDQPVIVV